MLCHEAVLTCPGVTGAGQSEQSFLLQNDAATNQEGGEQSQSEAQPQVVGAVHTCTQTLLILFTVQTFRLRLNIKNI